MDDSDPEITFDQDGRCNHCTKALSFLDTVWFPNDLGTEKLEKLAAEIKKNTKNHEFNAIIGLSGGVDSSYLAYIATKIMGLKVLAVHVDAGWNSDDAVSNIQNLTDRLGIELHTTVINWKEMQDLQLAFFRASVANQDIPQDHAFTAGVYAFAERYKIKYILSGGNFATESILPSSWGYDAMDRTQLLDIHRRFGSLKLRTFPTISFFKHYIYYPYIRKIKIVRPLNFIKYNKDEAIRYMTEHLGWRYYGGKHCESVFTKFFQTYYLPTKFGYDKRKAHLSSLIVSGQITRSDALVILESLPYDQDNIQLDTSYIAKKLGISAESFEEILKLPNKSYKDYKSDFARKQFLRRLLRILSAIKKLF